MSELLYATDTASRVGLVKALERAAAAGQTSMVETILGALTERFPAAGQDETTAAVQALNRAVFSQQWDTATYLSSYLADTTKSHKYVKRHFGGSGKPFQNLVTEQIEQEILRCLRDHVKVAQAGEPFILTDTIDDKCVDQGIKFALSAAVVDCAAREESKANPLKCARKMIGGNAPSNMPSDVPSNNSSITFQHIDPDFPPDAYGGIKNPCQYYSLANHARSTETLLGGDDPVVPPGFITVELSEPPNFAGQYTIETTGTRASLANAISKQYQKLYDSDKGRSETYDLSELDLVAVTPTGSNGTYTIRLISQE